MNKPLEEAIEYAQKLAALLATLDDREDALAGYEELDDEDHIASSDVAISSNPASYDIVPGCAGYQVKHAKAAYPGYRFYRKKEEETGEEWRFLEPDEIVQEGDLVAPKAWSQKLYPPDKTVWHKALNIGRPAHYAPHKVYARRIDAEPAAELEPKYRYDHHIGLADIGKEVQVRNTGEWKACGVLSEIGNDTPNPYARFYRIRNNSLKWRHCRIEEAQ